MQELPTVVAVDMSGAMPIIDIRVSSEPICNIGDTTEWMDIAAGYEPGLPAREIGGQPGALDLGFNLAAVENRGAVEGINFQALPAELVLRRDNIPARCLKLMLKEYFLPL